MGTGDLQMGQWRRASLREQKSPVYYQNGNGQAFLPRVASSMMCFKLGTLSRGSQGESQHSAANYFKPLLRGAEALRVFIEAAS